MRYYATMVLLGFNLSQVPNFTEQQVRAAARVAVAEAAGDPDKFPRPYERELRNLDKTFQRASGWSFGPYTISGSVGSLAATTHLSVMVRGPITYFGYGVMEGIRKMEPTEVPWPIGVAVTITPETIDAPNVERCVLTDPKGSRVEPLDSTLKPVEQVSRAGLKVTVNTGTIWYPSGAFQAGSTLTCIPTSGNNIIHKFTAVTIRHVK